MNRPHAVRATVLAALVACGPGEQSGAAVDTTARNLTLAPTDSSAALGDVPAANTTPAPAAPKPASERAQLPRTRPAAERPGSAAPATLSLAAGTRFELSVSDTITSRTAKAGDAFSATVLEDVKNAEGRVVLPAGSVARGQIVEVRAAPNANETGTLTLALNAVSLRGGDYPIAITVDSVETVHKGRGIEGVDAARVGAGAAAGAVLGRIVGKNSKGAVIGGVVGAAAGAGVSAAVKDVDIVLPKGAHIVVRLAEKFTVPVS